MQEADIRFMFSLLMVLTGLFIAALFGAFAHMTFIGLGLELAFDTVGIGCQLAYRRRKASQ